MQLEPTEVSDRDESERSRRDSFEDEAVDSEVNEGTGEGGAEGAWEDEEEEGEDEDEEDGEGRRRMPFGTGADGLGSWGPGGTAVP